MKDSSSLKPPYPKERKISHVIKRNGHEVIFDPEKIANAIYSAAVSVGGNDRKRAIELTDKIIRILNETCSENSSPTVEEIQDVVEKVLIKSGHARTAKAYILYRAEHARIRDKKESSLQVEDNVPYKLLWKNYSWNVDHSCDSVENLNRQMLNGDWKKLVQDSEKHYESEIKKVADAILKRKNKVRLMIIAGPSSSGKTTATIKIGECLKENGLKFSAMNLDHYFKNLDAHPRDQYGDYDFESPYALDLELINEHLSRLIEGKKIRMAQYDFKTGKRTGYSEEFGLGQGEILLIDSLHGLFSDLTASVRDDLKFKFYIEAICQIKDSQGQFVRWTDLRMMRRMIRDSWHRSYGPEKTVGHWHYVRGSEKKYIVPFINTVDYVFNGSMAYEIAVYKNFLQDRFPSILEKYRGDPNKTDAFIRSQRCYKLLKTVGKFPDVNFIPINSPLREFIGGSVYKY